MKDPRKSENRFQSDAHQQHINFFKEGLQDPETSQYNSSSLYFGLHGTRQTLSNLDIGFRLKVDLFEFGVLREKQINAIFLLLTNFGKYLSFRIFKQMLESKEHIVWEHFTGVLRILWCYFFWLTC